MAESDASLIKPKRAWREIAKELSREKDSARILALSQELLRALDSARSWKFPDWQPQLEAALLEVDPNKVRKHVQAAEAAIYFRLQSLASSSDSHAERKAIAEALQSIRTIQTEKLNYPG
jgi:hypothetical protein